MKNLRRTQQKEANTKRNMGTGFVMGFAAATLLCQLNVFSDTEVDVGVISGTSTSKTYSGSQQLRTASSRLPIINTAITDTNTNIDNACPLLHTSKLSQPTSMTVDKKAIIKTQSKTKLESLKQFTAPDYERFFVDDPGREHYSLWHYLTLNFASDTDCRHIVDIGTRYVASALALGATGIPVKTFDIPNSSERGRAFRGKSEQEWQKQVQAAGVHIQFYNLDLLKIPEQKFKEYMSTWIIILDTFHQPYSVPFEREFLTRLTNMEPKFEGLLVLDDIHLNDEMKRWWKEVTDNADRLGYKVHDLTSVGHHSGTGLLDFSGGKVSVVL